MYYCFVTHCLFLLSFCVFSPFSEARSTLRPSVKPLAVLNNRPIIGIAAQETNKGNSHGDTYIPSSYVKYLQGAGARVVPIRAGEPPEYYENLFNKINGVLFPGGGVNLITSQYARTGRLSYNFSIQAAAKGETFPLWGTCLGFELLNVITAGFNVLKDVDAENITLPLDIIPAYRESRMLKDVPTDVLDYLMNEPVTQNEHSYGMPVDVFANNADLTNFYKVLSTNKDKKGVKFVSMFEAFKYPMYGTQWHPEKNIFDWDPHYVINHSPHAILVAQYFANFFVGEARRSSNRFDSPLEESKFLISNFNPVFSTDGTFRDIYYFNFTQSALNFMNGSA